MKPGKILIFGKGQLGTLYREYYETRECAVSVSTVDIRDAKAVLAEVQAQTPDLIINAAAKTSIDWCEDNREECFAVNTLGADNIAAAAEQSGVYLMHISSGCVQESIDETDIKSEEDEPNPLCFYTWTKVWAENLLLDRMTRGKLAVLILRPRQLLSATVSNRNALVKMLTYSKFIDTANSCTVVEDLLEVSAQLVEKDVLGVVNVANPGVTSPYKIAEMLRDRINPNMQLEKISKDELNKMTKARRIDCVLDTQRLGSLGIVLPDLSQRLVEIVDQLKVNLQTDEGKQVLETTVGETQAKLNK